MCNAPDLHEKGEVEEEEESLRQLECAAREIIKVKSSAGRAAE